MFIGACLESRAFRRSFLLLVLGPAEQFAAEAQGSVL